MFDAVCLRYFFFQAEDGIRDHCVTGVQTCALPISSACWSMGIGDSPPPRGSRTPRSPAPPPSPPTSRARMRSEERRVGKECRSRGGAYHERKKKAERKTKAHSGEDKQTEIEAERSR